MLTKREKDYAEVMAWLETGKFDCMVTLTFPADTLRPKRRMRKPLSDEFADACLGKMVSRYMRKTRPRKSKIKIIMAPFRERTSLGEPHFHILFRLGEDVEASKTLLRDIWVNVAPGVTGDPHEHDRTGEKWFLEITNPEDRRRVIQYVIDGNIHLDGLVDKYTHLDPVNE